MLYNIANLLNFNYFCKLKKQSTTISYMLTSTETREAFKEFSAARDMK